MDEEQTVRPETSGEPMRSLPPAALRALAEAQERRRRAEPPTPAAEIGGRRGLDPARYGDWESGGIASDF